MGFPVTGGSVLVCWKYDDGPHGYLRQFDTGQATIEQQLQQMYAAGQRRLGLAVPYFEGGDTFACDSSSGMLTPQDRTNLQNLLALIKSIGFQHVLIEMIPEWSAKWQSWTDPTVMKPFGPRTWEPLSYGRDFSFTCDVWATTLMAGLPQCGIDLLAEAVPFTSQIDPITLQFLTRFWSDWCDQQGGVLGTVGFSMLPNPGCVANLKTVYANGQMPYLWDFHSYRPETELPPLKAALLATGLDRMWINGEQFTNDATDAEYLSQDPELLWGLQWGVGRDTKPGITQDRLTIDYSNYAAVKM